MFISSLFVHSPMKAAQVPGHALPYHVPLCFLLHAWVINVGVPHPCWSKWVLWHTCGVYNTVTQAVGPCPFPSSMSLRPMLSHFSMLGLQFSANADKRDSGATKRHKDQASDRWLMLCKYFHGVTPNCDFHCWKWSQSDCFKNLIESNLISCRHFSLIT